MNEPVRGAGPLVKRIAGVLYPDSEVERFAWVLDEAKPIWGEPG